MRELFFLLMLCCIVLLFAAAVLYLRHKKHPTASAVLGNLCIGAAIFMGMLTICCSVFAFGMA